MSQSLQALRNANPRRRDGFEESLAAAAAAVEKRIASAALPAPHRRRRVVPVSVGAAVAVAAAAAVFLTLGSSGRGPGVVDASATLAKAVGVSAASAEESGIAVVRVTHDGELWGVARFAGTAATSPSRARVPAGKARPGRRCSWSAG
jgi:hypothetical protein